MSDKKRAGKKRMAEDDQRISVPEGWKEPKFVKDNNPHGMLAESSFSLMFPKYREKYIQERWPIVKKKLGEMNLRAELDCANGTMTVYTTRKTWDPYAIISARDCIRLLARSVPLEHAFRALEDGISCDIIKLRNMVGNDSVFIRRRERLIGPDGTTLKAIELATDCYVLVQGSTVSAVGPYKGLKDVRKLAEDCMKNIHPAWGVKMLLLKRNLRSMGHLRNENWERFVPKFKAKNVKRKVPRKQKKKKEYTPFPPPQLERKEDKELASGEYFLKQSERKERKNPTKSQQKKEEKERQKRKSFIPPEEK